MLVKKGKPGGTGIVFLHGYGASAADLYPLAEELAWSGRETWYFPDAPLEVPLGPHFVGRAWFPIPLRELQHGVDYSHATPPGLEKAAAQVSSMLKTLPHEKLILGGFSQGSMVATQIVLSEPDRFKGLTILSGTLVHAGVLRKLAAKGHPFPVFQSHGTGDQVLPYEGAEKLKDLFEESGWEIEFHPFRGGHEIPLTVIRELRNYLQRQA